MLDKEGALRGETIKGKRRISSSFPNRQEGLGQKSSIAKKQK